ncbi:MAG: YCF48-related protein [Candidatus Didemnitutus sp.]|nr:YCF48-related protein [Candidatus Didemnitutus sp.]
MAVGKIFRCITDTRARLCACLLVALPAFVFATVPESSEPAPLAARSLLLDVARAGKNIVAVGNRGHVIISQDEGKTWNQSITPTRAMLTGVSFVDEQHGWAVGHDGVILATTDGGRSWQRQDSGNDLETVFLDVHFYDANHGTVVGAYGKFLVTEDGGKTWTARRPGEADLHLNRILAGPDGATFIVGEAGSFLQSHDQGKTWRPIDVPYQGSLFALVPVDKDTVIVAGLRGHILTTHDDGATWTEHNNTVKVLISTGIRLRDGTIVLAGQGGNFFLSRDSGKNFRHWQPVDFNTSIAEIIPAANNSIIAVGEAGAVRLNLP